MLDKTVNFFLVNAVIVLPLAVLFALAVSPTARSGFQALLRIVARPLLIAAVIALAYDGTVYMENSLKEISKTFMETVAIVGLIVFLFLGSPRSALVPLVTKTLRSAWPNCRPTCC